MTISHLTYDRVSWMPRRAGRLLAALLMLAALVPAAAAPAAQAAELGFAEPVFLSDTNNTFSTALGDMNGDGSLDLVFGGHGRSGQNSLYLNDGHGRFTAPIFLPSSLGDVYNLVLGDLNGDGALDIAISNAEPGGTGRGITSIGCQILLNDGSGHFGSPVTLAGSMSFASWPGSLALGDLNDDGALDIIAAGNALRPSQLYLNDGQAHFGTPLPIADTATSTNVLVALGDLNGDDRPDLLRTSRDTPSQIFLNDGTGHFTATATLAAPGVQQALVGASELGDLDGDRDLDIVISSDATQIFLNDGTGAFAPPVLLQQSSLAVGSVRLGDMNGDGVLDIVRVDFQDTQIFLNDGKAGFAAPSLVHENGTNISDIALGDLNGDAALDLVLSDRGLASEIVLSQGPSGFGPAQIVPSASDSPITALGDLNADGRLDLVLDSVGPWPQLVHTSHVYLGQGQANFAGPLALPGSRDTTDIAVGDLNGDGALDLVFSSGINQLLVPNHPPSLPSQVLINTGGGGFAAPIELPDSAGAWSIGLGDLNGDGPLDIVLGMGPYWGRIYLNDGQGQFSAATTLVTQGSYNVDVALGDMDGDGALDIVFGSVDRTPPYDHTAIQIYRNDGQGHFGAPSSVLAGAFGPALGDMNGDGALDIVSLILGNLGKIYLNDGRGSFGSFLPIAGSFDETPVLGDLNGDGALDVADTALGKPQIFFNRHDGTGNLFTPVTATTPLRTNHVSLGDVNGDGALDIIQGNQMMLNRLLRPDRLPNRPPTIAIHRPGPTPDAGFYSTPAILTNQTIPISYTLSDPDGDNVGAVRASYSLDGGGSWRPAIAATGTITSNLVAASSGTSYVFNWDTFASGVFGQSDNAVVRIEALPAPLAGAIGLPGVYDYPNVVAGQNQHAFASATTFPFRLRGTQIRVMQNGTPQPHALVYRLRAGQQAGGSLVGSAGQPFTTDAQGFLRGLGDLQIGDRLLALAPISATATYTMYATNGTPTELGLDSFNVTEPGVQQIEVSASKPLALFDLHVALEWDASASPTYLQQLRFNLARASQHLYDFTDGQVALRSITVHQSADDWATSDVVVHATNRLRPFAAQGGIVLTPTVDPQHSEIVYNTGQVHMGAVWNRYGTPGQDLGDDWSITLAHELSHYLLFQDDAYLGLDAHGLLRAVGTCQNSAMADPYTNPASSEFVADQSYWNTNCADTLGAQTLGRTEWQTIKAWYPQLNIPGATNPGPATMPFDFTSISIQPPITPTLALADPTFYLDYAGGAVGSNESQAFLERAGSYVIDLGNPVGGQNRLVANGAQPGDRICVFDRARQQYGCEDVAPGDDRIALRQDTSWTPVVQLTPVTSRTFDLAVASLPPGLPLRARLFPEYGPGGAEIALARSGDVYSGTFALAEPALAGHIQVWVDETTTETSPRRETIVTYAVGGNPGESRSGGGESRSGGGESRSGGGESRSGGGESRSGGAPLVSADGQMIFFTPNPAVFQPGQFYTVQSMAALPALPGGKAVIGQGYNLVATAGSPVITGSISFQYLGADVLVAGANESQLAIHFWNGQIWQALPTTRNEYFNLASAPSHGPGVYALLAGVTTPQISAIDPPQATNDVATSLAISGSNFLPPAQVALVGRTNTYTLPLTIASPTSATAVITAGLAPDEYRVIVLNGDGGRATAPSTFALYQPAPARFYDFFESGSARWQLDGEWAIATLPDGNQALTDSPSGPYRNAAAPNARRTTSATSQLFSLDGLADPLLSFRHDFLLARVGASEDVGRVQISADGGATWATLAHYSGGGVYGPAARLQAIEAPEWAGIGWQTVTISLRGYHGTVRLRFELDVDGAIADKGWAIDDVRVDAGAAPAPSARLFLPIVGRSQ